MVDLPDGLLDEAKQALTRDRFRDDRAVTRWLYQSGLLRSGHVWRGAGQTACTVLAGTATCSALGRTVAVVEIDHDGAFAGQIEVPRH